MTIHGMVASVNNIFLQKMLPDLIVCEDAADTPAGYSEQDEVVSCVHMRGKEDLSSVNAKVLYKQSRTAWPLKQEFLNRGHRMSLESAYSSYPLDPMMCLLCLQPSKVSQGDSRLPWPV